MAWTWEHEKSLGLTHLERMARLNRGFEQNWRESAERNLRLAEKYGQEAGNFERAAREVRGETAADLPPVHHRIMCGVATAKGLPCIRRVLTEGERCWWHGGPRLSLSGRSEPS